MERRRNVFQFGPFCLDIRERVLLRDGRLVPLAPKALSTLVVLVRNMGHVMEKDVLMAEVWPDEIVEEGNLSQQIFILRKALGETNGNPTYIETIPRRGYRFVAPVSEIREEDDPELVDIRSDRVSLSKDTNKPIAEVQSIAVPPVETLENFADVIHFEAPPAAFNPGLSPELDVADLRALANIVEKRDQSADGPSSDVSSAMSGRYGDSITSPIEPRSSTISIATTRHTTLTNLSQILRRPRVPVWQILVGITIVFIATGIVWRWVRAPIHVPPVEAKSLVRHRNECIAGWSVLSSEQGTRASY